MAAAEAASKDAMAGVPLRDVTVTVNGVRHTARVEPRTLLVHLLREDLGLTATHVGCDTTNCGACTVVLGGKAVKSCTVLAVQADGREITTVEGLSRDGELHPIQEAFLKEHGLQCGFCTPGMLMTTFAFLKENPKPTEEEIRQAISGNLCRCTGYMDILRSVQAASKAMSRPAKRARTPAKGHR